MRVHQLPRMHNVCAETSFQLLSSPCSYTIDLIRSLCLEYFWAHDMTFLGPKWKLVAEWDSGQKAFVFVCCAQMQAQCILSLQPKIAGSFGYVGTWPEPNSPDSVKACTLVLLYVYIQKCRHQNTYLLDVDYVHDLGILVYPNGLHNQSDHVWPFVFL